MFKQQNPSFNFHSQKRVIYEDFNKKIATLISSYKLIPEEYCKMLKQAIDSKEDNIDFNNIFEDIKMCNINISALEEIRLNINLMILTDCQEIDMTEIDKTLETVDILIKNANNEKQSKSREIQFWAKTKIEILQYIKEIILESYGDKLVIDEARGDIVWH